MIISVAQCKAARALAGMTQRDLAAKSGVSPRTIANFEQGQHRPIRPIMKAIIGALEDAGIEFLPANGGGQGVRLRDPAP